MRASDGGVDCLGGGGATGVVPSSSSSEGDDKSVYFLFIATNETAHLIIAVA
jgi:hypothetical protein